MAVGVDKELTRFYGKAKVAPVLGAQAFRDARLRGEILAQDERDVREVLRARPSLLTIVHSVALVFWNDTEADYGLCRAGGHKPISLESLPCIIASTGGECL